MCEKEWVQHCEMVSQWPKDLREMGTKRKRSRHAMRAEDEVGVMEKT